MPRWPDLAGGPDAARYIAVSRGRAVSRPFHLRQLLPLTCGLSAGRWWCAWLAAWPLTVAGFVGWQWSHGWQVAVTGAVLLVALPGILGPAAVIPVGVDLPATALTLCGCWAWMNGGHTQLAVAVIFWLLAAAIKETSPVFAALFVWSPLPLLCLAVPAYVAVRVKPGPDPLGAAFDEIATHPVRCAVRSHAGQWRDAWVMVAPWGLTLAALYRPAPQVVVALVVAYGLLLVATDTVRLYQHAAGPVMAASAAAVIPPSWALLACAVHVVWWRTPERV